MAQLTGFPFVGTGHIDNLTIYQRDGMVISRYRHNTPASQCNPSENQLRQRMRITNNLRLWNSFPKGYRPYFQWRRGGANCYNTFVSYAMQAHPVYLTRQMACRGACVLTDVMVSQGTLYEIMVDNDGIAPITNIKVGSLTLDNDTTVGQLAMAIVRNNFNYQRGDRLRYYLAKQTRLDDGMPMVNVGCHELVLDPTDTTPLQEALGTCPGFALRDDHLAASHTVVGGMAWVHLRQCNSDMLTSTQRMVCNNDGLMQQYGSEEAFVKAKESYLKN